MIRSGAKVIVLLSVLTFGFLTLNHLASGATFNPISTSCLDDPSTASVPCDGDYTAGGDGNLANVFKVNAPDANFSLVVTFFPPGWCVANMTNDCTSVDGSNLPTGGAPVLGGKTGTNTSIATLALTTPNGGTALNTSCNNSIPVNFTFYVSRTTSPGPTLTVTDGKVDINGGGVDNTDDGVVSGRTVIDGLFDLDGTDGAGDGTSGDIGLDTTFPDATADDGYVEHNLKVRHGLVDVNKDGSFNASDDGSINAGLVSIETVQIPNNPLKILTARPTLAGTGITYSTAVATLPHFVDLYPSYNLDILDPDGVSSTTPIDADVIFPRLRSAGTTVVSGTDVILQFLLFDKGALTALNSGPPYSQFTAGKGWPSFTVLQDPTTGTSDNPQPAGNGNISDFCSPLNASTTTLGTTTAGLNGVGSGKRLGRNALSDGGSLSTGGISNTGTHILQSFSRSQRDADNDGHENGLDSCPKTANNDGDPRSTNGADNDGLDSACDPTPVTLDTDEDNDAFSNRLDNCSTTANANQAENNEVSNARFPADGGPASDGIGDACDSGTVPDGASKSAFVKNAICNGSGDGDLNSASVKQPDGWCDTRETYLGTLSSGAGSACPATTTSAAWPPDFNNDKVVNVTDRTKMALEIKNGFNAATNKRFDLNADSALSSTDRTALVNFIGMSCTS